MDAPALASTLLSVRRKSAAAVIYPACHDGAPRVVGLDGKSAS
jgi:hypothetical protein